MSETVFDKHGIAITRYVGPETGDGTDRVRYQLTIGLSYADDLIPGDIVEMATAVITDDTFRKRLAKRSEREQLDDAKRAFKAEE